MKLDGKDLKLAREHMNLTQDKVAKCLKVGLTTYQRWEQSKRQPHPDMRQIVLDFFKDAFRVLGIKTYDTTAVISHEPSRTGWDCPAFMEFTPTDLEIETGLIYLRKGNQGEAMARFTKIIDPKELTLRDTQVQSACGVVAVINSMAQSVLSGKDRDMEEVIHFWTAGIQGAAALRSELYFDEALVMYHIMKVLWPGERRIEELAPLTIHWLVGSKVG